MSGSDIRSDKAGSAIYEPGEASIKLNICDPVRKEGLAKILKYIASEARNDISKSTGGVTIDVSLTKLRYEKSTGIREWLTDTMSIGVCDQ